MSNQLIYKYDLLKYSQLNGIFPQHFYSFNGCILFSSRTCDAFLSNRMLPHEIVVKPHTSIGYISGSILYNSME